MKKEQRTLISSIAIIAIILSLLSIYQSNKTTKMFDQEKVFNESTKSPFEQSWNQEKLETKPKSFNEFYIELSKSGRPVSVTSWLNSDDPSKNILWELSLDNKMVYYYSGDLVLDNKSGFVNVKGGFADILVSGNLYIKSNMKYEKKESGTLPRITVKWDVSIDWNVTETIGFIQNYGIFQDGASHNKWTHFGRILPWVVKLERFVWTGVVSEDLHDDERIDTIIK